MAKKQRSSRNKTLTLTEEEYAFYAEKLLCPKKKLTKNELENQIICADLLNSIELLPSGFVDLLILDPPYSIEKDFHGKRFSNKDHNAYLEYLESWFPKLLRLLKADASIYFCGDWRSSSAVFLLLEKYTTIRNRITWQREKGRGSLTNWKNACEDIWFATKGKEYFFNVDAVKMRRKVIAPYRVDGKAKDWEETEAGNFRLTHPSNFWDDISVPYWSMPENTDHPTQKPEKLMAKLILASTKEGDFVFDPFLGSGSSAVTAKKLGRKFAGIEINQEYCCWALARLERAESNKDIQGYTNGVFWERNTLNEQKKLARE